jgi:hypothetical protein
MRRLRHRTREGVEVWADGWAEGEGKGGGGGYEAYEVIKGKNYAVFYSNGKRNIFFLYL